MSEYVLPGRAIGVTREALERLISLNSGDAALLYDHLLLYSSADRLSWNQERLDAALQLLRDQGLLCTEEPSSVESYASPAERIFSEEPAPAAPAEPFSPADGVREDLCAEVEHLLEKPLSGSDRKYLSRLLDNTTFPPELVPQLVRWCMELAERTHGPGRKPLLSRVCLEGQSWAARGIETEEQAETYMREQRELYLQCAETLKLLDLEPRPLLPEETARFHSWYEMGFPPESIRLAYEETILRKQELNLNYMNAILHRWHERKTHTPEEIRRGTRRPAARAMEPAAPYLDEATRRNLQEQENRIAEEDLARAMRLLNITEEDEDPL